MTVLQRPLSTGCGCDRPPAASGLISIDSALKCIETSVKPVEGVEVVPLSAACGRTLATPVFAHADMPRFDHAAMDGYAVKSANFAGQGPWCLPVTGRVAAGDASCPRSSELGACRIFTGAPIPPGYDSVVMKEDVDCVGDEIKLSRRPKPKDNIRFQGEEHRQGAEIVPKDRILSARAIAACASGGFGQVEVRQQIRVTILASGSEIRAPGKDVMRPGQIWDVNTPMLQTLLGRPGVIVQDVIQVNDSLPSIRGVLETACLNSDLVVTTGGVSVGDEDHLLEAARGAGGKILFSGVSIKPGKPVSLGRIGDAVWLGLPGNPGSAFVTWSLFGEAVLRRLSGSQGAEFARRHVVLGHHLSRKPGRCEIRGAKIAGMDGGGRDIIACPNNVNSGQVTALTHCEGLAILPAEIDYLPGGALVEFLPFYNI